MSDNGELPTDLDALLEAVEVMMGEEFAEELKRAAYWRGRLDEQTFWHETLPGAAIPRSGAWPDDYWKMP